MMETLHSQQLIQPLRQCLHRPFSSARHPHRRINLQRLGQSQRPSRLHTQLAAAAGMPAEQGGDEEKQFEVFPRLRERDPYRRLALRKEASTEEIVAAKNYLLEQYKWHEQSRESIELAYDDVMQDRLRIRNKIGFKPPRTGRRGEAVADAPRKSLAEQFMGMFDVTLTGRGFVNEFLAYVAFAAWCFMTGDPGLPLATTFIYSIYKIQEKRKTRNPDGPFFGGNPLVGAILTASVTVVLGSAVSVGMVVLAAMALGTTVGALVSVQSIVAILLAGVLAVVLK